MNEQEFSQELTHYGVRGMRWGRRKARATADIKPGMSARQVQSARGNAAIANAGGSRKRALGKLAARQLVTYMATNVAMYQLSKKYSTTKHAGKTWLAAGAMGIATSAFLIKDGIAARDIIVADPRK